MIRTCRKKKKEVIKKKRMMRSRLSSTSITSSWGWAAVVWVMGGLILVEAAAFHLGRAFLGGCGGTSWPGPRHFFLSESTFRPTGLHPYSFATPRPTLTTLRSSSAAASWKKPKKKKKKDTNQERIICVNRVAYRNYEILETLEAGVALTGTEVKSVRQGKMNLRDGFIKTTPDGRGCLLYNVHIAKYESSGAYFQHEEKRPRPLLIHSYQARPWHQQTKQQGMTIIPLKAYLAPSPSREGLGGGGHSRVKIQIALCRGKNVRDKRQDIQERDAKREASRLAKTFRLG